MGYGLVWTCNSGGFKPHDSSSYHDPPSGAFWGPDCGDCGAAQLQYAALSRKITISGGAHLKHTSSTKKKQATLQGGGGGGGGLLILGRHYSFDAATVPVLDSNGERGGPERVFAAERGLADH